MNSRRKKRAIGAVRPSSRPIDKNIISIGHAMGSAQIETVMKTTTFPCTIVGIRWALSAQATITTGATNVHWAIVVVRDGNSTSIMSAADGTDFYTPEQDVLAFGVSRFPDADLGTGPTVVAWEGSTKTMRKLMGGDVLNFITLGSIAGIGSFSGIVQFFCKS